MDTVIQQVTHNLKRHESIRKAGRRVERYLQKCREMALDMRYNINTRWDDISPVFRDDEGYGPISYAGIKRIQSRIGLMPNESLMDIGCGRGRAICVFARQAAITSCVGVEFHPIHARIAQQNAINIRGAVAPITVIHGDAAEQTYNGMTLFLLVNPFGEATMRRTLERIRLSLQEQPRAIRLVYVHPKYEHVLAERPWLGKTDSFFIPHRIHSSLPVSLWCSTGQDVA